MPRDGVYAHNALLDAGARPDDHVSSPMPKAQNDAAVAVPDPFDEPTAAAHSGQPRGVAVPEPLDEPDAKAAVR